MPRNDSPTVLDDLLMAFGSEFGVGVTPERRFGSVILGYGGMSDGAAGVQWNVWMDRTDSAAYLGVNLEGLKYDDWPIARFIEREFRQPRLFDVRSRLDHPELVQAVWYRDAWRMASRPAIEERHIGVSLQTLPEISPDAWQATLREAYACLEPSNGYRGRRLQFVTVKRGVVELPVTPHLQFRRRLGGSAPRDWTGLLQSAHLAMAPLYEFVVEQSRR